MRKIIIIVVCTIFVSISLLNAQGIDKNAFKTTFLSVYTGSVKLAYERVLRTNQTIEATIGAIGWAHDSFNNQPSGVLFHFAHKFIFSHDRNHPLHGSYLKPLLAISNFKYDTKDSISRSKSTKGALMACVGYQWAKNALVTDVYAGIGGAVGNSCDTNYEHGFMVIDRSDPAREHLAVTFGVKMGLSF